MNINEYLKKLHLSEKESETYLALLASGESSITPISKKVDLPRTTVFYILERLSDKHLIDINDAKTRRTYIARPLRTIITLLNYKKSELESVIDDFKTSLPEFDRTYHQSPFQPGVRFFNKNDIRLIYEEMLEIDPKKDEIWYVAETAKIVDTFGADYTENWIKRRIAKKIPSRSIRVKEAEIEGINTPFEGDIREYRFAPPGFNCPAHILIYQDSVAIITTSQEAFGTVITSKEYAATMRSWFEQLWCNSK